MAQTFISVIVILIIIILVIACITSCNKQIENYKDPIWLNKKKFEYDYYTRSNGSIYGIRDPRGIYTYDMFMGFPSYPRAY
jgi:hypothetical protein